MEKTTNEKKRELGQLLVRIQEAKRNLKRIKDDLSKRGDELIDLGEKLDSSPLSVALGKSEEFISRTVPKRLIVSDDLQKFLNVEFLKQKLDQVRELEGELKDLAEKRQELEVHLYKD